MSHEHDILKPASSNFARLSYMPFANQKRHQVGFGETRFRHSRACANNTKLDVSDASGERIVLTCGNIYGETKPLTEGVFATLK